MHVIGAGLGCTGTRATAMALETLLGGRCYHLGELLGRPTHVTAWQDHITGGAPLPYKTLLAGYRATMGFPTCLHVRALMRSYPHAKVVLTTRDPVAWWRSWNQRVRQVDLLGAAGMLVPKVRRAMAIVHGSIRQPFFGGHHDKHKAIAAYKAHHAEVIATVPAERLLVFEVDQGWGPLCDLLDRPLPDLPFPHPLPPPQRGKQTLEQTLGIPS